MEYNDLFDTRPFFQDYVLNDALFRVFDEDDSGTLNFFEWFQASNVKNMATIEEKLNWIFTAFDADGGGSIDSEEIVEIVKWMFRFIASLIHNYTISTLHQITKLSYFNLKGCVPLSVRKSNHKFSVARAVTDLNI